MLFGQDQCMAKMNWVNIEKRENLVILKQDFSRYLSRNYFAENTISHIILLKKKFIQICLQSQRIPRKKILFQKSFFDISQITKKLKRRNLYMRWNQNPVYLVTRGLPCSTRFGSNRFYPVLREWRIPKRFHYFLPSTM